MTPEHSHQVFTRDGDRVFVKHWVSRHHKLRPSKCLLLVGPPGLGKSTLATLCLRESHYSLISVAADCYRNAKGLAHTLEDALRLPLKQAVLIEDPQVLAADGGLQVVIKFVKRGTRIPIILVCCKSKKAKIQQVVSHADLVYFEPMPQKKLMQHFNVTAARCFDGDLRQISQHKTQPWGEGPRVFLDLPDAATKLLGGETVKEGVGVCRIDRQALQNIIHANYTDVVTDCQTAAAVAHDLSDADALSLQGEGLHDDLAGIVGCVCPGQRIRQAPRQLRPDLLWTKFSLRQVRLRNLASSQHAFGACGTLLDVYTLPVVRDSMLQAADRGDHSKVLDWAPTASLQQLTTVMRMSLSKTETTVNKFRRAVKRHSRFADHGVERIC